LHSGHTCPRSQWRYRSGSSNIKDEINLIATMGDKAEKRNSNCKNQAESRFVPGKSPERLSPYYRLPCDAGTALIKTWGTEESTEPLYLCEAHAKEFQTSPVFRRAAASTARRKEHEPVAQPKKTEPQSVTVIDEPSQEPSARVKFASTPVRRPTAQPQSLAHRCEVINRQINELVSQLESVLAESDAAIDLGVAIDGPIEQAILEIIGDAATSDMEKDAAMARLGEFQQGMKLSSGERIRLPEAYRLKRSLEACLNADLGIPRELTLAYRALHKSLEQAISNSLLETAGHLVGTS
jgi:hypothetical protein